MLHLLPFRVLSVVLVGGSVALILLMFHFGIYGRNIVDDFVSLMKAASIVGTVGPIAFYLAWRWIPWVQKGIFPYLGGVWKGHLSYDGKNGKGKRDITLTVNQSPFQVRLILDSKESVSRTLSVQADRDGGTDRNRLYYVFLNERKEGVTNPGQKYRGLAVLGVVDEANNILAGDYFTEAKSLGQLHLSNRQPHPWWSLWK
jgi:hypothetical protein